MPLYEYACRACGHQFETLVRTGDTPACPSCKSADLERLQSLFAVNSEGTRQSAFEEGRRAAVKDRHEQRQAEKEAIKHHSD